MKHVHDGELHAYLDGALDLLPGDRGEEIREHLASCAACRERLEEEKAIRARAGDVLEEGAPLSLEAPPFEEIRKRARGAGASGAAGGTSSTDGETVRRRRRPVQGLPLAWAATVVLALGVGWMGGRIWETLPQGRVPTASTPEETGASPTRDRSSSVEGGEAAAAPGGGEDSAGGRPSSPGDREIAAAPGVVEDSAGARPPVESARARATLEVAQEQPSPETEEKSASPRLPVEPDSTVAPTSAQTEGLDRRFATSLHPEDPAPESSMTVPGLEVLGVEWEEWVPGERGLHVRQLLPTGDTLELRFLGLLVGSEPRVVGESQPRADRTKEEQTSPEILESLRPLSPKVLEASLPPGWNQVVMRWGRGWVVARAPLPIASIKALLRSIQ